ncbi:MAG: hypothetical protein IPO66_07820 [Rhodanobacteraceae bacterium]|nr:hypothetical protein [Rhodanobacteraceae bacterium]
MICSRSLTGWKLMLPSARTRCTSAAASASSCSAALAAGDSRISPTRSA